MKMRLTQMMLDSSEKVKEISPEELEELKKTLLSIYKDVLFVCQANNLQIFLCGGSCLGAVRHKGFIPWDDDIDVAMFRKDYDLLPNLLNKAFPEKYECICPETINNSRTPFLEIHKVGTLLRRHYDLPEDNPSICIDVFPIENVPQNIISQVIHAIKIDFFFFIAICVRLYEKRKCVGIKLLKSTRKGSVIIKFRLLLGFLFHIKKSSWWDSKGNRIAKKFANGNYSFVTIPTGRGHYFGEMLNKNDIIPPVSVPFEDTKSFIFHDYTSYLSSLYGNKYMQLPPESKREHHFCLEIKF